MWAPTYKVGHSLLTSSSVETWITPDLCTILACHRLDAWGARKKIEPRGFLIFQDPTSPGRRLPNIEFAGDSYLRTLSGIRLFRRFSTPRGSWPARHAHHGLFGIFRFVKRAPDLHPAFKSRILNRLWRAFVFSLQRRTECKVRVRGTQNEAIEIVAFPGPGRSPGNNRRQRRRHNVSTGRV